MADDIPLPQNQNQLDADVATLIDEIDALGPAGPAPLSVDKRALLYGLST